MSILTGSLFSSTGNFTHPVYEGYSFEHGGAQALVMESFEDSLAVMEALAAVDIHLLRESSTEVVVEAVTNGVIEKIKNALKKLWGKIKAFFASIVRFFDGMVKSGADFAKKYENQIRKLDLTSFKYKMYRYSIPEDPEGKFDNHINNLLGEVKDVIKSYTTASNVDLEDGKKKLAELKESRESTESEFRAKILGESGKIDAEDFRKELFAHFRSGATDPNEKEEISVDIFYVLDVVKSSGKLKKSVEKALKNTDKRFNDYLKEFTNASKKVKFITEDKDKLGENEYKGNASSAAIFSGFCQEYYRGIQFSQTAISQYYNAWIEAIKERDRTYKKVLVAAFRHKEKE